MVDKDFYCVVGRLLVMVNGAQGQWGSHAAYTVSVEDDLRVDLIGFQEGFLNLRAVVGELADSSHNSKLLRLLYANDFAFEHPPMILGVDPKTTCVTLWSRQALVELHDDVRCQWFDRFIRIASVVQAWLRASDHRSSPIPAAPPIDPSGDARKVNP